MLTWAIVPNDRVNVRPLIEWVAQLLPRQSGSNLNLCKLGKLMNLLGLTVDT